MVVVGQLRKSHEISTKKKKRKGKKNHHGWLKDFRNSVIDLIGPVRIKMCIALLRNSEFFCVMLIRL